MGLKCKMLIIKQKSNKKKGKKKPKRAVRKLVENRSFWSWQDKTIMVHMLHSTNTESNALYILIKPSIARYQNKELRRLTIIESDKINFSYGLKEISMNPKIGRLMQFEIKKRHSKQQWENKEQRS